MFMMGISVCLHTCICTCILYKLYISFPATGQFQVFADFEYFTFDEVSYNFSRFYGFKQSFFMILQVA